MTDTSAGPSAGHAHGLHLETGARADARRRLLSIRGHVEGVLRMLEDDSVYCVDVLAQIKAVTKALDKVGELILRSHLENHVATAHERGDTTAIVDELMTILKYR